MVMTVYCVHRYVLSYSSYKMYFNFQGPGRLSNLTAPIMLLTGHEGDIFTAKFSPDGDHLASGGFDRLLCMLP